MHVIACNEIYYIVLQFHYMSLHRGGFADVAAVTGTEARAPRGGHAGSDGQAGTRTDRTVRIIPAACVGHETTRANPGLGLGLRVAPRGQWPARVT